MTDPDLRRRLRIGRHVVEVDAPSEVSDLVDLQFGPAATSATAGGPVDVMVRIEVGSDAEPESSPSKSQPGYNDESVRFGRMHGRRSQDRLTLNHPGGGSAVAETGSVTVRLEASSGRVWPVMRQLLSVGLSHAINGRGSAVLHGALLSREGTGLLIVGDPGSGKSTFAAAALTSPRWSVHGDDLTLVWLDGERLVAGAVPRRVSLPAEYGYLGEPASGEAVSDDPRGRVHGTVSPAAGEAVPLGAVIIAGHSSGVAELVATDPDEAFAEVVVAFEMADHRPSFARHLGVLTRVARLPVFHGLHDRNPALRLAAAITLTDAAIS